MDNVIESALLANSETASIEFKESFDIASAQDWCEIIKDIVAIANTDGGVIVFGLNDAGVPIGMDVTPLLNFDPADITNKISKYTGYQFSEFQLAQCEKQGHMLVALTIQHISIPLVFEKPGTYDTGAGKQKTAFSLGTVYFRHGAKSEPGNTDDLRRTFEKRLEIVREAWLTNVRQVVEAPLGATILTIQPNENVSLSQIGNSQAVRVVNDPNALPVNIKEEDILKIAPYDYRSLRTALHERYSDFLENSNYHNIRKPLEGNPKYCRVRHLDPSNPKSGKKCFYTADIFEEFDKHYKRRNLPE